MNSIEAFEDAVRSLGWNSPDSARSDLVKHPLVSEYIFAVLQDREIISITSDGRVIALEKKSKRKDPKASVSEKWKDTWPDRFLLMACVDDRGTLGGIRDNLRGEGKPCGHWLTLHALWRLIKDGDVIKTADGYEWSERYKASVGQSEAGAGGGADNPV